MGDTFGVGVHVTEAELQVVVQVPADIEAGWSDPEEFQQLVERVLWDVLDRDSALQTITTETAVGDTVGLGTVTLKPDGTLVEHSLSPPG
jgi:hypothetical protein